MNLFFLLGTSCTPYRILQQLAVPRADEWTRLVHTLQELHQNQLDEDMEKLNFGVGSSLGSGPASSSLGIGSSISQLAGTTSPPSSLGSMSSSSSAPLRQQTVRFWGSLYTCNPSSSRILFSPTCFFHLHFCFCFWVLEILSN